METIGKIVVVAGLWFFAIIGLLVMIRFFEDVHALRVGIEKYIAESK